MSKLSDTLKSTAGVALPTLAGALGGPYAGIAVKFLTDQLLGKEKAGTFELEHAIKAADPLALQKLENDFKAHLASLGVRLEEIEAEDRDSARKRDIELMRLNRDNIRADVICYGTMTLLAICVIALITHIVPEENRELLATLVGALILAYRQVTSFEFGSIRTAEEKDEIVRGRRA